MVFIISISERFSKFNLERNSKLNVILQNLENLSTMYMFMKVEVVSFHLSGPIV